MINKKNKFKKRKKLLPNKSRQQNKKLFQVI